MQFVAALGSRECGRVSPARIGEGVWATKDEGGIEVRYEFIGGSGAGKGAAALGATLDGY